MEISFITPVGPGCPPEYLRESYRQLSLLPAELDWEWLLQFDGPPACFDLAGAPFLDAARVRPGFNPVQSGAALTRNNALSRCSKAYCLSLDSDDLIIPAGVVEILREIQALPELDFAIGECVDLFPSGARVRRFARPKLGVGRLPKWSLLKLWLLEGSLFFQPGPILYRTGALQAIGGWPALPSVSDFELLSTLLHVEGRGEGLYSGCDLYLYRQHPGQNTRTTRDEQAALQMVRQVLVKNPDSPEALERLRRLERGDASLIFSQHLFSERWRVESGKLRQELGSQLPE